MAGSRARDLTPKVRLASAASALGFLWALAATLWVVSGGGYEGITTRFVLAGGEGEAGYASVALGSADGVWLVALLAVVSLLAALPAGVAWRHPQGVRLVAWFSGMGVMGFSLVTVASVGPYYLPSAVALLGAGALHGAPWRSSRGR